MSQNIQKILALVLLIFLLIAVPLTVWFGSQQQQVQQRANVGGLPTDSCGFVTVSITESPSACLASSPSVNPVDPTLTSYKTTATLKNISGKTISLGWVWAAHFCPKGSDRTGSNLACLLHTVLAKGECNNLAPGQSCTASSNAISPSVAGFSGQACGFYQNDFSFVTTDLKCNFGSYDDVNNSPGAFSWCNAGKDCVSSTPTPTPTVTPSPTPTATPTPPSCQETCTTDSDCVTTGAVCTNGVCSPSSCITPTATPTPSPTPGPTATPTPPSNPTSTPVPPTATVKPTLPPTGPGDVVLGIGLFGMAAAVIGTIVILAL